MYIYIYLDIYIPQMDVARHSYDMLSEPLKWVGKPTA